MSLIINPEFEKTQTTYRASTEDVLYQLQEIKTAVSGGGGGGDTATATNQEEQIVLQTSLNSLVATSAKQDTLNALITSLNSLVATSVKQIEQINLLTTIYNLQYRSWDVLRATSLLADLGVSANLASGGVVSNGGVVIPMFKTIDDTLCRIKYCTLLVKGDGLGVINVKGEFNGSTSERMNIEMRDAETGAIILNPIDLSIRKLIKIDNTVMSDYILFLLVGTPTGNIFIRKGVNIN
jgi:hypothetical protein